jgi:hypothetical protein
MQGRLGIDRGMAVDPSIVPVMARLTAAALKATGLRC